MEHSERCPSKVYEEKCQQRGVAVRYSQKNSALAVCLVIMTGDKKILLTRRHPRIIFPHAWVMPGGLVEPGETLENAVLRETQEETGLKFKINFDKASKNLKKIFKIERKKSQKQSVEGEEEVEYLINGERCQVKPFYAFESASYRYERDENDLSPASTTHLILFFLVELRHKSSDFPDLRLQYTEVDGALWLGREEIDKIFKCEEEELDGFVPVDKTGRTAPKKFQLR